ncbi:hypothetical protein KAH81_00165, partial [bacterium]|nr:hypothetical protein [bacterium]
MNYKISVFFLLISLVGALFCASPGPTAIFKTPIEGSWAGCEFQNIHIRLTDLEGIDITSVRISVNGVNYSWPDITHLSWDGDSILIFTPTSPFPNGNLVNVSLLEVEDMDGTPISAPLSWSFSIDIDKPFCISSTREPIPNTTINDRRPDIRIEVKDTTSGIPLSGLCICFDSRSYNCPPDRNSGYCWESGSSSILYDDTFFTILTGGLGVGFQNEDSVTVRLRKAVDYVPQGDEVCGPNWIDTLDTALEWSFRVDIIGPRSTLLYPNDGDTIACDTLVVFFEDFSGVNIPSCKFRLGLILASEGTSPYVNSYGDTIIYSGTGTADFYPEGYIPVYVNSIRDEVDNQSLYVAGDHMEWHFLVDKSPPVAYDPIPSSEGVSGGVSPEVSIALDDSITDVDVSSIVFSVEGIDYPYGTPLVSWDGLRASFNTGLAGLTWDDRDTVEICVRASDIVKPDRCGPNTMDTAFCWTFYIDQGGPIVQIIDPPNDSWTACENQEIKAYLYDPSGVDISTLVFSVDGMEFHGPEHSTYLEDTLVFTPPFSFSDGDLIQIVILEVLDSAGTHLDSPVFSEFYVDLSPPLINSITPIYGSIISADEIILFGVSDSGSGVRPENSLISINGDDYLWPSGFTWDGTVLSFDISVTPPFSDTDTLEICLRVADNIDSLHCGPNETDSCFTLFYDNWGPLARLVYPEDSVISACIDSAIKIVVFDNFGVDWSTLQLDINGLLYSDSDPEIIIRGDSIIYTPPVAYSHLDTIEINLIEIRDLVGNDLTGGSLNWSFIIDSEPPSLMSVAPPGNSVVGTMFSTISLVLYDSPSGVDETSFFLSINGITYTWPHAAIAWDSVTMTFDIEETGLTFSDGDTLVFCAEDLADNVLSEFCGPNCLVDDTCWSYIFDLQGPTIELLSPSDDVYSACPYQHLVFRIRDNAGIVPDSFELNINGEIIEWPEDMSFSGDTLVYDPSESYPDGDTIRIEFLSAYDSLGNGLSGTYGWSFFTDRDSPELIDIVPPSLAFIGEPIFNVELWISDALSGVDPSSFVFSIDGIDYTGTSPWVVWDADHFTIDNELGGFIWDDGDTVQFCLDSISDLVSSEYCGPNWANIDTCLEYIIDLSGPEASIIFPHDGAITSCFNQEIRVLIQDINGINESSIRLEVNEIIYGISDPELFFLSGSLLVFTPSIDWIHADTVTIRLLSAEDVWGTELETSLFWSFVVDVESPQVMSFDPVSEEWLNDLSRIISIEIEDTPAGVDTGSISIRIGSSLYNLSHPSITWTGSAINFTLADFIVDSTEGETLAVCLETVSDLAEYCPPNTIPSPICSEYYIDVVRPSAHLVSPPDSSWISCPLANIIVLLSDGSGIADSTIEFEIEDETYSIDDPKLDLTDSILTYTPDTAWMEGVQIVFELLSAEDLASNPFEGMETSYSFGIDTSAPVVVSVAPIDGSLVDLSDAELEIAIIDNASGVDFSRLWIIISDDTLGIVEPAVTVADSVVTVDLSVAGISFFDGEFVEVCLDSIYDKAILCGANLADRYCWSFTIDGSGPIAELLWPPTGIISSCPRESIVVTFHDPVGVDFDSLVFEVNGEYFNFGDPEITILDDTTFVFIPDFPFENGSTVEFEVNRISDNLGHISASAAGWNFIVDLSPPVAYSFYPLPAAYANGDSIALVVEDSISGVQSSSIVFEVMGYGIFDLTDPGVHYESGILSLDPLVSGISFTDSDTVTVCVSAEDMPDICPPNRMTSVCWDFTIDNSAPFAELISPASGTITSCENLAIILRIIDPSTIDESSIRIAFEGEEFTISDPEIGWDSPFLEFTPDGDFGHGDTVRVVLTDVSDMLGNVIDSAESVWTYYVIDINPPFIDSPSPFPPPGSTVADPYQFISLRATDFPAGVDHETAVLSVDGVEYPYPSLALEWVSDELNFDPRDAGIMFEDGDTIEVCLENLADLIDTCPPNNLVSPYCWEFQMDLTGPTARILRPIPNRWVACRAGEQLVELIVRDDDRVNSASIRLSVNGVEYDISSLSLTYIDSVLTYRPEVPWEDGDTVYVELVSASDNLGNPLASPIEWRFFVDLVPPFANSPYPPEGSTLGQLEYARVSVIDEGCGVFDSSIIISINSEAYSLGMGLVVSGGNAILYGDSLREPVYGDLNICLTGASDKPDYCDANSITTPFCWAIYIDVFEPEGRPINPALGDYVACDSSEQEIAIYLRDEFGILADSIEILVDGELALFTDGTMTYGDSVLTYFPDHPWEDGDTIRVQLLSAPDSFGNPIEPFSYSFYMDLTPPYIWSITPPPGDTVSPESAIIKVALRDELSGVDSSSIVFIVGGSEYRVGESDGPHWFGFDSTAVFDLSSVDIGSVGDELEICVRATDSPDWCEPNEMLECFRYFIDDDSPTLLLESPAPNSCSSCSLQGFRALFIDESLIDDTTIVFRINGDIFTGTSDEVIYSAIDRRVYFVPSEPWDDGDIVHVDSFYTADILGNLGENLIDFEFTIDRQPPIINPISPLPGGFTTRPSPDIVFTISDSGCGGINSTSIRFSVDGELLSLDSSGVHYSPDTINFDSGEHGMIWDDGDTIEVCVIGAADEALYCGQNYITTPICWWFTINSAGPTADIITPEPDSWIACDSADQLIRIFLADPDGVEENSISLFVDSVEYTTDSTGLIYSRPTSTLTYRPSIPWVDGDTINVLLFSAEDSLGNSLPAPLSYDFYVDLAPPETTFVNPPVGIAIHPGEAYVEIGIEDFGAGIIDSTIEISLNGVWYSIDDAGVFWSGETLVFDGSLTMPPDTIFAGDTVQICVRGDDSTSLCGPNSMLTCWPYITTSDGPYAEARFPAIGAISSCVDTGVHIFINDSDGDIIVPHTIYMIIDDSIFVDHTGYPDVYYSTADTTLYVNVGPRIHGDTVFIEIDSIQDIYHSPLTEPFELWYVIDIEGPEIVSGSPSLGLLIPPGSPDLSFLCSDFPAGIDHSAGEISFFGLDFSIGSGAIWREDTLVLPGFVYSSDTVFFNGDSVGITITLFDSAQYCGANESVLEWWFKVGVTPPIASIISPTDSAITSCDGGNIRITMTDDDGLNYDSCGVWINEMGHYPSDPNLQFIGDTLIYNNPGEFNHGDTVRFWPSAMDVYGAKLAEADTFVFIVDNHAPSGVNQYPSPDDAILNWISPVSMELSDELAGIDYTSLIIDITTPFSHKAFTLDTLGLAWTSGVLIFDPDIHNSGTVWEPGSDDSLVFWHERDTVEVEVSAKDMACCCGANDTSFAWSFSILDDDTLPPTFTDMTPLSFWSGLPDFVYAVISDPSGIFDDYTDVDGQGVYLLWDVDGSLLDGGEAIVQMESSVGDTFVSTIAIGPFYNGDMPVYCISAYDDDFDFEETIDRSQGISDTFFPSLIIGHGPIAQLVYPENGAYSSCDSSEIVIFLHDEQGVDLASIQIRIDVDTFSIGPNLQYSNDTLYILPLRSFTDGQVVTVEIIQAHDVLGYGLDSLYSWQYNIDTSPPEVEIIDYSTLITPDVSAEQIWHLTDAGAGITESTIVISIDSDIYDLWSSHSDFNGDYLVFNPEELGYSLSETTLVCVSSCDEAQYCAQNCSSPICVEVRRSKTTPCEVWPIPFTPNNDGANDVVWFEYPRMEIERATIEIFNLEGERLFKGDFP